MFARSAGTVMTGTKTQLCSTQLGDLVPAMSTEGLSVVPCKIIELQSCCEGDMSRVKSSGPPRK